MWRIDDDHTGTIMNGIFDLIPVDLKMRRLQGQMDSFPASQLHGGSITVIAGIKNNHFIPGLHHRLNGTENGNGRAGGNTDFGVRIKRTAGLLLLLRGQLFSEQ